MPSIRVFCLEYILIFQNHGISVDHTILSAGGRCRFPTVMVRLHANIPLLSRAQDIQDVKGQFADKQIVGTCIVSIESAGSDTAPPASMDIASNTLRGYAAKVIENCVEGRGYGGFVTLGLESVARLMRNIPESGAGPWEGELLSVSFSPRRNLFSFYEGSLQGRLSAGVSMEG